MGEEWEVREWRLQGFDPGAVRDLDLARPGYVDHFWLPAIVPGDVHTTLKEAGVIPDPFF
ncbi:MAG: hypothetical protein IRY98_04845, partial [Alicyclobacillaceae bacterium]|nr:hypothetical protein [Alicyclobacillaceae bacterium]